MKLPRHFGSAMAIAATVSLLTACAPTGNTSASDGPR